MEEANTVVINPGRIKEIFIDCVFNKEDVDSKRIKEGTKYIRVSGVHTIALFNPDSIEKYRDEIKSYLDNLSPKFRENEGGGYSFISVPFDKDENQWGEQIDGDRLMMLGIACGYVGYLLPKELWVMLPGSVPYYIIFNERKEVEVSVL